MKKEMFSFLDETCKRYNIDIPNYIMDGEKSILKDYMMNKMNEKLKYVMNPDDMIQFFIDCCNMQMIMIYPRSKNMDTYVKWFYDSSNDIRIKSNLYMCVHMADEEQPEVISFSEIREKCWVSCLEKHTNRIEVTD